MEGEQFTNSYPHSEGGDNDKETASMSSVNVDEETTTLHKDVSENTDSTKNITATENDSKELIIAKNGDDKNKTEKEAVISSNGNSNNLNSSVFLTKNEPSTYTTTGYIPSSVYTREQNAIHLSSPIPSSDDAQIPLSGGGVYTPGQSVSYRYFYDNGLYKQMHNPAVRYITQGNQTFITQDSIPRSTTYIQNGTTHVQTNDAEGVKSEQNSTNHDAMTTSTGKFIPPAHMSAIYSSSPYPSPGLQSSSISTTNSPRAQFSSTASLSSIVYPPSAYNSLASITPSTTLPASVNSFSSTSFPPYSLGHNSLENILPLQNIHIPRFQAPNMDVFVPEDGSLVNHMPIQIKSERRRSGWCC